MFYVIKLKKNVFEIEFMKKKKLLSDFVEVDSMKKNAQKILHRVSIEFWI